MNVIMRLAYNYIYLLFIFEKGFSCSCRFFDYFGINIVNPDAMQIDFRRTVTKTVR